ncbi:hypothetical protein [Kitasatospora sp. NPDC059327]|uniref:hypothetical protein n=1 Tax=Kitasatospora sp. NPDC059327 TaxID=3346803 RepID=UPI0036CD6891
MALLEDEWVAVELINDGLHLQPSVLDLAHRTAGASRIALIVDGPCPLGPLPVQVEDGVAVLVDDSAIGEFSWNRAVESRSTVPARFSGLADRIGTRRSAFRSGQPGADSTKYRPDAATDDDSSPAPRAPEVDAAVHVLTEPARAGWLDAPLAGYGGRPTARSPVIAVAQGWACREP